MKRVTKLVGEGAEAEEVVSPRHHYEGIRATRAAGERALTLTLVAYTVNPALLQAALTDDLDAFLAEGSQALAYPVNRLLEGHIGLIGGQGCLDVIDMEDFYPHDFSA